MGKCAKKKCIEFALENRKLCEYHNEKNKEKNRRNREKNNSEIEEKKPNEPVNFRGMLQHFDRLEGHRHVSTPAFMSVNEHKNAVRVTDTAIRDNTHIEQTRTTKRDFKNQTEHEEVKTVISSEVTKIQRQFEQVATRIESIYLEHLKAHVTCDNIQENPDLKLLDETPDEQVKRIAIRIGMSFYEWYSEEAMRERAEIQRYREKMKASFKTSGACPLPSLEEKILFNELLPDIPNPTKTVRENFGRDISILILKRQLDMKQYRLKLLNIVCKPKEDSDVFQSRVIPGLSEEYEEFMKEEILNMNIPDYDMYAQCDVLDIERDLQQRVDILVSVYQIYLKRKQENDTFYKKLLNSGFQALQEKKEFQQNFLPPNYLECQDDIKDMDRVYQLCVQRDFELPPPGTEDRLSEKLSGVLHRYRLLSNKNIQRYFPKHMIREMQNYYDNFNCLYGSSEHERALNKKRKLLINNQVDRVKSGEPFQKIRRITPADEDKDREARDKRDYMN